MVSVNIDEIREYGEKFNPVEVYNDGDVKVIAAFFDESQFIPVHAPSSTLVISLKEGRALVRDDDQEREITKNDVVVVPKDKQRGIKAINGHVEAIMVVLPPPTDDEHEPVRKGIKENKFEP